MFRRKFYAPQEVEKNRAEKKQSEKIGVNRSEDLKWRAVTHDLSRNYFSAGSLRFGLHRVLVVCARGGSPWPISKPRS